MARQLALLTTTEVDWRLDERTKELGRRGISDARAALRRAMSTAAIAVTADR